MDVQATLDDIDAFHQVLLERGEVDPLPGPPSADDLHYIGANAPVLSDWYQRHDGGVAGVSGVEFLSVREIRTGTIVDERAQFEIDSLRKFYEEQHINWPPGIPFATAQGAVWLVTRDGVVLFRPSAQENWDECAFTQVLYEVAESKTYYDELV
jgi:hypothetical protein